MALQDELISIEKELWTGGEENYLENLDADCLVAFAKMAGVQRREPVAKSVKGDRWRDLEMEVEGMLAPSEDIAFLTYRARALRGEG
jgi:hypothetical protein